MDTHDQHHFPKSLDTSALPAVVDRATWQAELDTLRVREKAHTREGDAIAAARQVRELSYLHSRDVTYATFCEGPYEESIRYRDFMGWDVPWYSVPQDAVDQLVADRYFGILVCYLRDGDQVFETYWTTGRGNEVMAPSYGLLDMTVYGRQETWEDSPEGWPQRWGSKGGQFCMDGRPTAQWSRLAAGRSDDLGTGATATAPHCCQNEP